MKIMFNRNLVNKILKKTPIILSSFVIGASAGVIAYDLNLNYKLEDIKIDDSKTVRIHDEFKENRIFVMNDSQGVNLNVGFWKNGYPEYLEQYLNLDVIDCSSLRYNKTNHVDMLFDNNLSVAEVKEVNNSGICLAVDSILDDYINNETIRLAFQKLGVKLLGSEIKEEDYNIYLSETLKNCSKPIIIYSSGANDIMYMAKANPSSLSKYDKNGNITEKFLYAQNKLRDEETINQIILQIENNFKRILSINGNAKIIALSIYVPKSLEGEEYIEFANAIYLYNEKLKELCEKYNIVYIDEEQLGSLYNQDSFNFHINEVGHKQLAKLLIEALYIHLGENVSVSIQRENYNTLGLLGFYEDLKEAVDSIDVPKCDSVSDEYLKRVYEEQKKEKIAEANAVYQKIEKW